MPGHIAAVSGRWARYFAFAVAWGLFVLVVVWPIIALVHSAATEGPPSQGGYSFTSRQLALLWRSLWMAFAAAGVCLLISVPGAYVAGRARGPTHGALLTAVLAVPLFCPPMVYAFGWDQLLPAASGPNARCIGVWALWAWPIPALLIGSGWARTAERACEAGLLVAKPAAVYFRIGLPLLAPYAAIGFIILFVLFFGDYAVPHACGLVLYSTELLGWSASSSRIVDGLWPALPSVVAISLGICLAFVVWRSCAGGYSEGTDGRWSGSPAPWLYAVALIAFFVSCVLPVGALVISFVRASSLLEALRTYWRDIAWSMGVAASGAAAVMIMGLGMASTPRAHSAALAWTLLFGSLPGALTGTSLIAGYNNDTFGIIYDNWPIVGLVYAGRFAWIGLAVAMLLARASAGDLAAQARTDGAPELSIASRIQSPIAWTTLLFAGCVVVALSVAEVPASTLVRVPGPAPIAHVIIEKFHRFEYGMLASLSLFTVVVGFAAAGLLFYALKAWSAR